MMSIDEEALLCDLAETYNIYSFEQVPIETIGILASGLRDNSRIMMKISGDNASIDRIMQAMIFDKLNFLAWTKTQDAHDGNKFDCPSFVDILQGNTREDNKDFITFENPEDFFKMRDEILKGK